MANMLEREFEYRRIPRHRHPLIIGYDNNPVYDTCSTIAVPRMEMARGTVDLLIGHLTGKCRIGESAGTTVPTRFIFREGKTTLASEGKPLTNSIFSEKIRKKG